MTIINGKKAKYVTAITGGGTAAISNILSRGGASSWFLESLIPYSKESLVSFLGKEPDKFVSQETANQMALKSYMRALELNAAPYDAAGLGVTAVLGRIENERVGRKHEAYVAVQFYGHLFGYHIVIPEHTNIAREAQEHWIATEVEKIILEDDIKKTPYIESLSDDLEYMDLLLSDKRIAKYLIMENDGVPYGPVRFGMIDSSHAVYSGSFDPFHAGHASLIRNCPKRVWLELSIMNVDKPPVNLSSLLNRLDSIVKGVREHNLVDKVSGIVLTNTPKFFDKVCLLGPYPDLLVGSDTAARMIDKKYGSVEQLFDLMETYGTRAFFGNRPGYEFKVPKAYDDFFVPVGGTCLDISSTKLRKGNNV